MNLQVTFLPFDVVQCNGSDEYTKRSQKVHYKDEFDELPGTPYGLKQPSHEKETDNAGQNLERPGNEPLEENIIEGQNCHQKKWV